MTDRSLERIDEVIGACRQYWLRTGVTQRTVEDMTVELGSHLAEAVGDGGTISDVVGSDLATFAESWAAERRRSGRGAPKDFERLSRPKPPLITPAQAGALAMAAVLGAAFIIVDTGGDMEQEVWRWVWLALSATLIVGEVLTAGFFLLPFAIGAAVAAALAWLDLGLGLQWAAFLVAGVASFIWLQRFAIDDEQPAVGANRFQGKTAVVLQEINDRTGTGRVRMGTEEWRAVSGGDVIPEGAVVKIVDVTGARLVVEPDA
ncbi:MAG: NfeD family protein [Acidimicrobiia bacterium]|nr:NfeD family protein [Acidimicrobiia bacterium]